MRHNEEGGLLSCGLPRRALGLTQNRDTKQRKTGLVLGHGRDAEEG